MPSSHVPENASAAESPSSRAGQIDPAALLYVIGDSHASLLSGVDGLQPAWPQASAQCLPGIQAIRLGPRLAYSLTRVGHDVRRQIGEVLSHARPDAAVLLALGEIDCRCHVVPQAHASSRTPGEVARELARAYVQAARSVLPGRKLGLLAAPPPPHQDLADPAYPTRGSFAERTQAVAAFNDELAACARSSDVHVISIQSELVDARGTRRESCFRDLIHCRVIVLPAICRELIRCALIPQAVAPSLMAAAEALSRVPLRASVNTVYTPPQLLQRLPPKHDMTAAIEAALLDRAALECVWLGASRVAVYGAGQHTQRIGLDFLRNRGLEISAVLDDEPKVQMMFNVPVISPATSSCDFDAVVISSDAHEDTLSRKAAQLFNTRGTPIVRIYAWREPWPSIT